MPRFLYHLLADGVLLVHIAFVAFVVLGLTLILVGGIRRWAWVRNRWFRRIHLAAICLVVVQAWSGILCPLTVLENHLREQAGDSIYQGSFIAHWLHRLIFFDAPLWVFTVCYTAFALAVIASWWFIRPRGRAK